MKTDLTTVEESIETLLHRLDVMLKRDFDTDERLNNRIYRAYVAVVEAHKEVMLYGHNR